MKWIAIQPLIGGMAIGAEQAIGNPPECIISSGNSNESHLINYYKNRSLDIPYLLSDSSYEEFVSVDDSEKFEFFKQDVDIVIGVPVCSGLSLCNTSTGTNKARGADAVQNDNMYNITKMALSKIKPKVFIFENAPALYTNSGKPVADKLFEIAKENGYSMSLVKTTTLKHGIPQDRQRTFAFFWKSEVAPIVNFHDEPFDNLSKYLGKIPKKSKHYDDYLRSSVMEEPTYVFITHKYPNNYRERMIETRSKTAWQLILTDNLMEEFIEYFEKNQDQKFDATKAIHFAKHILNKIGNGKGFWDGSIHYTGDNHVNAVIGKNIWKIIHPNEDRFLNIRELLHLMGHPHDFELLNPLRNINHIAQNVPVNTAACWISECVKFVKNELKLSNSDFIKQNNISRKFDTKVNETNSLEDFF